MSRSLPLCRPEGRRTALRTLCGLLLALAWGLAEPAQAAAPSAPRGRPRVSLDRLVFPSGLPNGLEFERHLKLRLRREARRADWGAGSEAKIEFRFVVEELTITQEGNVLRVRCTAKGSLPRGKSARSHIEYGGHPARRNAEVKKVLEIVARGVITRLAELERRRRLAR